MKNGDLVCQENGTRLGDPGLIAASKAFTELSDAQWEALPESEQLRCQVDCARPMPFIRGQYKPLTVDTATALVAWINSLPGSAARHAA